MTAQYFGKAILNAGVEGDDIQELPCFLWTGCPSAESGRPDPKHQLAWHEKVETDVPCLIRGKRDEINAQWTANLGTAVAEQFCLWLSVVFLPAAQCL